MPRWFRPVLRIRHRQLLPFMQPFLDWAAKYLATSEARLVEGCSRAEIDARVWHACGSALEHGISDPTAMLQLVVLFAELGPALDEDLEARAILGGPGDQRYRVDALLSDSAILTRLRERPVVERWPELHSHHDVSTDD